MGKAIKIDIFILIMHLIKKCRFMTELVFALNKLSPQGLAFDELAQYEIYPDLAEAVQNYAFEILENKMFITNYKGLINMVINNEYIKRPFLSIRQKVLIREQIWLNATKNLNTLALNTAVTHITIQLKNSGMF
jgi:hypothetical protein